MFDVVTLQQPQITQFQAARLVEAFQRVMAEPTDERLTALETCFMEVGLLPSRIDMQGITAGGNADPRGH